MTKVIEMNAETKSVFLASGASTHVHSLTNHPAYFPMSQADSKSAQLNVVAGTWINRSLVFRNLCTASFYQECAAHARGVVGLETRNHVGMPIIICEGGNVPLREFVDCIDENIDFDDIRESFPQLSYAQIDGAIKFLHRLSEFNMQGTDLSLEEDRAIESSQEFQDHVRKAMTYSPSDVRPVS